MKTVDGYFTALYTIYLENNPISTDPENAWQKNADYKREVKHLLPSIKQIDASDVTMFGTTLLLEHAMKVVERIFEHRMYVKRSANVNVKFEQTSRKYAQRAQ